MLKKGTLKSSTKLQLLVRTLPNSNRRRVSCCNHETYQYIWPLAFSHYVPAALPLSRWAARKGIIVRGVMRLKMSPSGRLYLITTRNIREGTVVISLPPTTYLEMDLSEKGQHPQWCHHACGGYYSSIGSLTRMLVSHLHNPSSQYRPYVEFLHDIHNIDADQDESLATLQPMFRRQLDHFYAGNSLQAVGVPNAPFLEKEAFQTLPFRVEWDRLHSLIREIQQGLPHFTAASVPWAMSMALSRHLTISKFMRQTVCILPIIDFAMHSYDPNTIVTHGHVNPREGTQNRGNGAHVQLVAKRDLLRGEAVSILYSPRSSTSSLDKEYWKFFRGFVPSR